MSVNTRPSVIEQSARQSTTKHDTRKLVGEMQGSLNGLEKSLDTLNQQSSAFNDACIGTLNMDRNAALQDLYTRLRNHWKAQDRLISDAKKTIRRDFKEIVADRLREDISARIKSEISAQVNDQVNIQIREYIPVPLDQQVADNKRQISDIKVALFNSEARARNSALEATNLDEPLMPILKLDGSRSQLYPADIRSLLSYDLDMAKKLLTEFTIEADDILEVNHERFMRHIGIRNVRAVAGY